MIPVAVVVDEVIMSAVGGKREIVAVVLIGKKRAASDFPQSRLHLFEARDGAE